MRKAILVFTVLGLAGACRMGVRHTQVLIYCFRKGTGRKWSPRVPSSMKWLVILKKYLGQETMLAGAVVSIDHTDEGYFVLAKWLPYPKNADRQRSCSQ